MACAARAPMFIFVAMSKLKSSVLQIFVWLVILAIFTAIGSREGKIYEAVVMFFFYGLINISIFYVNLLYILPTYLNSRRFLGCFMSIVALVLLSSLIKYSLATLYPEIILEHQGANGRSIELAFWQYYVIAIFTGMFFIVLSTGAKFAVDWFMNEKIRKNLENEKLSAELSFLKSQINPHFLFNSLNNIYSLAYRKSDMTPQAILKLSEMMRYMLQESNEPGVELAKEIRYIENYIELQRLRFRDGGNVQLRVSGSEDGKFIAPLILIPFIENAFKHGLATDPVFPISIEIALRPGWLELKVSNRRSDQNKDESSGIGLQNVTRRLELLYKNRYQLHINDADKIYICNLVIEL